MKGSIHCEGKRLTRIDKAEIPVEDDTDKIRNIKSMNRAIFLPVIFLLQT